MELNTTCRQLSGLHALTGGATRVCTPQIHSVEGIKGFYRGCVTNLLRTTPAAALTFTSFELISRHLKVVVFLAHLQMSTLHFL